VSPNNRVEIERANLRHLIDHPEDLVLMALSPRDFSVPELRAAYSKIIEAAQAGQAVPEDVMLLLTVRPGEWP
jgi:hypothetical protein